VKRAPGIANSRPGYGLVAGFAAITAAFLIGHAGSVVNLGFPLLAAVVAFALFIGRPAVYVAFVWWIWLFAPEVRRLVDYQTGYHNISPVMVTPLLVTGFAVASVLGRPSVWLRRSMQPFLIYGLVLCYAFAVGLVVNGILPACYDFVSWLFPAAFGLFLISDQKRFANIRRELLFAIISGLLAMSVYGIYQFYEFPPWDSYWLAQSQLTSSGLGLAEQVRIFGPLNSAGPYAVALMSSLVFAIVTRGKLRIAAAAFGFPAFALTLVRAAWGGWLLAALFILWRVGGKTRLRIAAVAGAVALVAVPLMTAGPVANLVSARFATFQSLQKDNSFVSRQSLYENFFTSALSEPLGIGFGQIGLASKLTTGNAAVFDSGILQIPYEFGWAGGIFFIWAVAVIILRAYNAAVHSKDRIVIAGASVFFVLVAENVFASTFGGGLGISLWVGLALAIGPVAAARKVSVVAPADAALRLQL
jgi:hypothetical protein